MSGIISEIEDALVTAVEGGGGVTGLGIRAGLGAVAGFGLSDIINYIKGGGSQSKKIPPYALVDLKRDKVLVFMGARRAYRILLRPRRRARTTKTVIREVPVVERR